MRFLFFSSMSLSGRRDLLLLVCAAMYAPIRGCCWVCPDTGTGAVSRYRSPTWSYMRGGITPSSPPPVLLRSLQAIAQCLLLHLAGGRLGQGTKDDALRCLESRQLPAHVLDEFDVGGCRAFLERDERNRYLTPLL